MLSSRMWISHNEEPHSVKCKIGKTKWCQIKEFDMLQNLYELLNNGVTCSIWWHFLRVMSSQSHKTTNCHGFNKRTLRILWQCYFEILSF